MKNYIALAILALGCSEKGTNSIVYAGPRIWDKGDKGDKGDIGPMGPMGMQGFNGVDGKQGDVGPMGPQGLKGDKGDKGDVGPAGIMGLNGLQGPKGDKGDTGAVGPQGQAGKCHMFFGDSDIYRTTLTIKPTTKPSDTAPDCSLFYRTDRNYTNDADFNKVINGWRVSGSTIPRDGVLSVAGQVCLGGGNGSYYFYLVKKVTDVYVVDIPNVGAENVDDLYLQYFYKKAKTTGFSSYFSLNYVYSINYVYDSLEYIDGDIKYTVSEEWTTDQTSSQIAEIAIDVKVVVIH
jgi:hypothetical protein